MSILKRGFLPGTVALIWLSVFNPVFASSQETDVPSGEILSEASEPASVNRQPLPSQEEITPSTEQPQQTLCSPFPFLPSLSQVIVPGHIKLDDTTLDEVYQYQLNRGINNFTTFAAFLIVKSQQALYKKDSAEAIRLARVAKNMAPLFPEPVWALARAYRTESMRNFYQALREDLSGHALAARNFRSLLVFAGNSFFTFFLAFFLTICVFSFVLLMKYFRLLAYDLSGFATAQSNQFAGYILATALILLPILLGLGCLVTACWWLVVLAVYFTKKEKHVILVFFLTLILLPWSFKNGASMILAHQAGIVDALYRANNEDWTPETEKTLQAWLLNNPDDTGVLFTLALIKKREGKYDESASYYNAVLRLSPSNEKAMGNLGNIYLAKGQLERAEETYKKAIETNPKIASFHYNLYRTYLELYKFLEAQKKQELLIATRLDPALIEHQEKILNPTIANRMTIDEILSLGQFWEITFRDSKDREELASVLWEFFFKGVPLRYGTFVFVVLCFCISFVFFHDLQKRFSTMCNKCGRPLKRGRLIRPEYFSEICQPCITLFIDEKKGDPKIRENKLDQVQKFQTRQNLTWKVLTYVLPGAGHLWVGYPGLSALLLVIFFSFILKGIFWNGFLRDHPSIFLPQSFLAFALFIMILLGFYLLALYDSRRKKEGTANFIQSLKTLHTQSKEQKPEGKDTGKPEPSTHEDWQQL